MAALTPILTLGTAFDPLYYAELDFLGLENNGWVAAPTDFTGFNEITRFSRDAYDWLTLEHFPNGVHNALKIAKAVIAGDFDPQSNTYKVNKNLSYVQDANGVVSRLTGAEATLTRLGAGNIQIDLLHAMANTDYRVFDATPRQRTVTNASPGNPTVVYKNARCWLVGLTDANTFRIKRKTWAADWSGAVTDGEDGPFCILVHGAP